MLFVRIVSFHPFSNSIEIGIIFLITVYRNENWAPKVNTDEHHRVIK